MKKEEMKELALKADEENMSVRVLRGEVSPKKTRDPIKKEYQCPACGHKWEK